MKINTKKAIIALSGGMDSCVSTAIAKLEYDELFCLSRKLRAANSKKRVAGFQ